VDGFIGVIGNLGHMAIVPVREIGGLSVPINAYI
jgi:hypothetical protein